MSKAETPRIAASRKTMGDCLFHFLRKMSKSFIPVIEPSTHQAPVHPAYYKFIVPYKV